MLRHGENMKVNNPDLLASDSHAVSRYSHCSLCKGLQIGDRRPVPVCILVIRWRPYAYARLFIFTRRFCQLVAVRVFGHRWCSQGLVQPARSGGANVVSSAWKSFRTSESFSMCVGNLCQY